MGSPVVKSTNGFGTPVTVVASGGLPVDIATNGFGTPIIEVASGGIPITYAQGGGVLPALPIWKAAVARVQGGTGRAIVACIGDSTTRGVKGGDANDDTDSYKNAYPKKLAEKMAAAGIVTQTGSWIGNGNVTIFSDPRLTAGSNWTSLGTITSPSIGGFGKTGGATDIITFTPGEAVDKVRLILYGAADFVISIETDGGANLQQVPYTLVTGRVSAHVITFPRGTYAFTIRRVSGTPGVLAIDTYDSTTPKVSVMNLGIGSVQSAGYNTAVGYNPGNSLKFITPDLVIIDLGINDRANNIVASTYKANLDAIIQYCIAAGADVMLKDSVPTDPALLTPDKIALDTAYYTTRRELAAQYNLRIITNDGGIGAYNAVNYNADGIHPNKTGYNLVGTKVDVDVRAAAA